MTRGRGGALAAVGVVLLVASAAAGLQSGAYSTGTLGRAAGVAVANDEQGVIGVDLNAGLNSRCQNRLLNLTNGFDHAATVTLQLQNADPSWELYVEGTGDRGATVSVPLAAGGRVRVDFDPNQGGNGNGNGNGNGQTETVTVAGTATAPGFSVTFTRSVTASKFDSCTP